MEKILCVNDRTAAADIIIDPKKSQKNGLQQCGIIKAGHMPMWRVVQAAVYIKAPMAASHGTR